MQGIDRKLKRLFNPETNKTFILALDHGANEGMTKGLESIPHILENLPTDKIQAVILNKGLARHYGHLIPADVNLIIQLNSGTKHGSPAYNKNIVCSIPEALRLGADAVAMQVNIGNEHEDRMLVDLGEITDEAHQLGIPVLSTILGKGAQIVDELNPSLLAHCIRLGAELGADIVAVPNLEGSKTFDLALKSSPIPVLVTGGPTGQTLKSTLRSLDQALSNGGAGCCIGRYIFNSDNPIDTAIQISTHVHKSE